MNSFELGFFTELEKIAGAGSGTLKGLLLGGLGGAGLSALLAAKGVDDLGIDVPGMPKSPIHDSMFRNLLDEKMGTVGVGSTLLGGATGGVLGARSKHNLTQEMARSNDLLEQYLQDLQGQGLQGQGLMSKLKGLFGRK